MYAAKRGEVELIRRYVSKTRNIDMKGGWVNLQCLFFIFKLKTLQNSSTALMKAAEAGHVEVMRILVNNGANVDLINEVIDCLNKCESPV